MGVPRLFKHLTERYPSLCQTVVANQLLSYDYLYIDLNNLIHKALSEKCLLPLEKVDDDFWTEARIFERVLRYIETLHRIIPSKVLFLSIDGVAPRAKWSTQRGRRVQAAERNEPIPFDKNAISPGTTFMANFESALLDFISSKNTFHHCWQNCEVFISGSNVPGEGSIKIINFIGSLKQKKNYKSDATHCIYSCDNDYLMLGLTTQELYISLLQERKNCPSTLAALCFTDIKHQFIVIHFEMLRQYLRMEFIECEEYMKFAFNMDSIVNDWVVLMTLFGNDYLPSLPTFVLDHDVLTIIYDAYKSTMKSSNGYINEQGLLNVRRFARLLQELKDRNFELYRKKITKSIETVTNKLSAVNLGTEIDAKSELTVNDFLDMKDQFYAEHLGNSNLPDFENMSIDYLKTIQWVLFYYHDRKFSWTHQYPYKCAPFAGDFVGVHRMTFSMDFDKPVNVFTHLLAILPKSSANLLPKPYHQYMSEEMDEMEDLCQKSTLAEKHLTIDEKERNALKTMLRIRYVQSEDDKNKVEISTISNNKNKNPPQRSIDRPIDRNNFNFMFSTLTLHDFSGKIIQSLLKPYPRSKFRQS